MTGINENMIIERIKTGDINAFEILVNKYERSLFILVSNILNRSHRVEDLVQDIFLSAYQGIQSFDPALGRFSTWLFKIARNRCINEFSRKKEKLKPEFPAITGPDNPVEALLQKEMFIKLDKALMSLPDTHRTVFVLAELKGCSYAQISKIEGIKIGTVRSRLSRAKDKLRSNLKIQAKL